MIQRKRFGKSDNVIVENSIKHHPLGHMHASSVSTAILSAMLAIQDECVTSVEGIIDNDVDNSVHNFTRIGKDAMDETDKHVLDIILKK